MNIEEYIDDWQRDSSIDRTELGIESLKIPTLHSKWLRCLTKERQKLKSLQVKKQILNKTLHEYFSGDLNNPEDLNFIKREPFLKKVLRTDLSSYIDTDSEMINLNLKIIYHQELVDVLDEILKAINGRNWIIRNAVDWYKLINFSET